MTTYNIEWKNIYLDGIESCYSISNNGQVLNRDTNELRVPSNTPNGYLRIILYMHGKSYAFSIHQLVAQYFVPNLDPINNIYIDHKDGNKHNNWYWNLEWVTPKENTQRAIALGLTDPKSRNQPKGSKSGVSIYTEEDAHNACKLLEQGLSNKEIADKLNVSTEFVRSIKRGRAWVDIRKQYNVTDPEKRSYYSDELRDNIRILIACDRSDLEIARALGLPDPDKYGKKYVNKIRSRDYNDEGSTTIPWIIFDFNRDDQQEYGASIWRG